MSSIKHQKQGRIFLLLSNKSKIKKEDIAKGLEIHPSHLSKIFNSELLTSKVRKKAAAFFNVDESVFFNDPSDDLLQFQSEVNEPTVPYFSKRLEDLNAGEVFRYLEEKDKRFEEERVRHHEERVMLLNIIENLTKK